MTGPEKRRGAIARPVGMSGRTLEKATMVVAAAIREPETFSPVVEDMDRTRKVDRAYTQVKAARGRADTPVKATAVAGKPPTPAHAPSIQAPHIPVNVPKPIIKKLRTLRTLVKTMALPPGQRPQLGHFLRALARWADQGAPAPRQDRRPKKARSERARSRRSSYRTTNSSVYHPRLGAWQPRISRAPRAKVGDAIVHASGSGATQACLVLGAVACLARTRVIGIDIDAEPARVAADVITWGRGAATLTGLTFDETTSKS
jgi:hypothetical protein